MKCASASLLALAAFLTVTLAQTEPALAGRYQRFYKHHVSVGYTNETRADDFCRVGWWQSLRYGQVRPYWAVRCH